MFLKKTILFVLLCFSFSVFALKTPFRFHNGIIFVEVRVGTKTGLMVFDTGSTGIILNPFIDWTISDIQPIGEGQLRAGVSRSKSEPVSVYTTTDLFFGLTRFNVDQIGYHQLFLPSQNSFFAQQIFRSCTLLDNNVIGIFGINYLFGFPFSINFEAKTIKLYPNGFGDIKMDKVPMLSQRIPIVSINCTIGDSPYVFLIDSGFSNKSMIHSRVSIPDSRILETWNVYRPFKYFSESSIYKKVRLDNLVMGQTAIDSHLLNRVTFIFHENLIDGILGTNIMKHFIWYFDFTKDYVGIVPIKIPETRGRFIRIDNPGLGILLFSRLPSFLKMEEVDSSSVLLRLGLFPDAMITKINDVSVDQYSDSEIQYLFSGNVEISVEYLHENKTARVLYEF